MPKQPEDESLFSDEQHMTPDQELPTPGGEGGQSQSVGSDADPFTARADADAGTGAGKSNTQPGADENEVAAPPNEDPGLADDEQLDAHSLRTELAECRQRVVRLQAELENYRKRAQRTLQEERRYASLPLMRDLLGVVDNLQRAIDAAQEAINATPEGPTSAGLLEGVKMVAGQLTDILQKHHCEEIPAEGTQFDPNVHEAIAQFPSPEHEAGEITQVTQTGYRLHDRVVRPAQVIVAAAQPGGEQN